MKRRFSQIRRLFLTGFCILLLVGGIIGGDRGALAVQLPPGDYSSLKDRDIEQIKQLLIPSDDGYSPYARDFPQQVFWGDLHLHTVYSFDAASRETLLGPEDAYRFARGQEVKLETGQKVKLSRPLDFLAVTDHSDGLGAFEAFLEKTNKELLITCRKDYKKVKQWQIIFKGDNPEDKVDAWAEIQEEFGEGIAPECLSPTYEDLRTAWKEEIKAAEDYNDPGYFTALIGYEWTSLPDGNNLHRNVIFRDNGDKAQESTPYTAEESNDPEDLWNWMQDYEEKNDGHVLAIPHNGNLSNGLMFADTKFNNENPTEPGEPMTQDYAHRRQLWEPLYEVTQIKGTSETHTFLSPDDEFASFETAGWDNGNLNLTAPKTNDMYEHEYARSALKNGLEFEDEFGANPFKFGLIGSTDSHISLSATEENNYFGKSLYEVPSPDRATRIYKSNDQTGLQRLQWSSSASGYVGVWARENTREDLFDALKRREVYATTGPRILVRLFGGWNFTPDDVSRNPGDVGYDKGVPMGDDLDLSGAIEGKSPTFLVAALKDPIRGNLDRIQIIKGWLDANGESQEKVYDVVWSDADVRKRDANDKVPPVGSIVNSDITDPATDPGTVDTETAEWTNTIGAVELATVWTDPDFDPSKGAFYYARVLEIPTPRWTDYDKAFYGDEWCAQAQAEDPTACDDIPLTLQERAYTSPIWYSPIGMSLH